MSGNARTMQPRRLGATGLAVLPLALGCGNFGGVGSPRQLIGRGLDETTAFAAMDEAVALGIDLFDTATSYAGGASERMIGAWLAHQPPDVRAGLHIATKVGIVATDAGTSMDLSPRNIEAQLRTSLERLGLDRVELCLAHAPDPFTPLEATLEGFAAVTAAGLVTHVGVCNVDVAQLESALAVSMRLGLPRYAWVQNEYHLLKGRDEEAVLSFCAAEGLGYTAFSPIAGGVLSGRYQRGAPAPPDSRVALRPADSSLSEEVFDCLDHVRRESERRGCSMGALALAWVLTDPRVSAAICGPGRQPPHLALAAEAASIELDEIARDEIGRWSRSQPVV
jgi:aryl-alcohol dehydrogenase-like predicted oxidoreductase